LCKKNGLGNLNLTIIVYKTGSPRCLSIPKNRWRNVKFCCITWNAVETFSAYFHFSFLLLYYDEWLFIKTKLIRFQSAFYLTKVFKSCTYKCNVKIVSKKILIVNRTVWNFPQTWNKLIMLLFYLAIWFSWNMFRFLMALLIGIDHILNVFLRSGFNVLCIELILFSLLRFFI
jgi:hypothetical protein